MNLKEHIENIKDFPKKGIMFRDITTLLENPTAFRYAVNQMVDIVDNHLPYNSDPDIIIGPESRGFIFGTPLAYRLKFPFVPIRKKGKLPRETKSIAYSLEYGEEVIEIHSNAISPGDEVIIVDDLLATGGTAKAACKLVEEMGGKVAALIFLIELDYLKGRELLKGYPVYSLVQYDSEE